MKKFTRVEPSTVQKIGDKYPRYVVFKNFQTDDGVVHEFTTFGKEGSRSGAVIALTPDGQVITCYQFRAGPEKWMFELPGGGVNDDEDPQVGVLRELSEETGYSSSTVISLGTTCRDAYTNTVWHYYLARDCVKTPSHHTQDEEEIAQGAEVKLISIDDLITNAVTDNMTDPTAVLMAYDELRKIQKEIA